MFLRMKLVFMIVWYNNSINVAISKMNTSIVNTLELKFK